MNVRATIILVLVSTMVILSSASVNDQERQISQSEISIIISGFTYSPNSLTLTAGEIVTVSVSNNDGASHTFTIRDGSNNDVFDLILSGGASGSGNWTVPNDGDTYSFYCRFHPSMTGTISISSQDTTNTSTVTTTQTTSSEIATTTNQTITSTVTSTQINTSETSTSTSSAITSSDTTNDPTSSSTPISNSSTSFTSSGSTTPESSTNITTNSDHGTNSDDTHSTTDSPSTSISQISEQEDTIGNPLPTILPIFGLIVISLLIRLKLFFEK